ncbi:hypothetical protein K7B10_25455 [Streptomyces flavotricini]|uniref:Muconolactone isomerase domain-containing protein n=1 Tax=Streptomyces flavotricini TaxID=66888 RepID=A0ABS8EAV7_9ACTN|nr:DUF3303 family protein [Streptomyces flavotricini]MCC0098059.1 hypothetical protein [Streptomyces flavotricini]
MRVMLRAHIDTQAGNEATRAGTLPQAMKKLMEKVKPEAAYFGPSEGVRSCWIVFDMQDSAEMPALLEGLFTELNAEIEISPVMNAEDLAKGLSQMQGA